MKKLLILSLSIISLTSCVEPDGNKFVTSNDTKIYNVVVTYTNGQIDTVQVIGDKNRLPRLRTNYGIAYMYRDEVGSSTDFITGIRKIDILK